MCFLTTYGIHLGDPRYILMEDYDAFVISAEEALRARKHMEFQNYSMLTDKERDLAHEAWLLARLAA